MKYLRTRGFTKAEGKFSIWEVFLSKNEIKAISKKHPNKLTYDNITRFKVITKVKDNSAVKITMLDKTDNNIELKSCEFIANVVKDEDDNAIVTFTADDKFTRYINEDNEPNNIFTYNFRYDFLGYTTGSFYKLFFDVYKSGHFATINYENIDKIINIEDSYTDDTMKKIKNLREKVIEIRKVEYAKMIETKIN